MPSSSLFSFLSFLFSLYLVSSLFVATPFSPHYHTPSSTAAMADAFATAKSAALAADTAADLAVHAAALSASQNFQNDPMKFSRKVTNDTTADGSLFMDGYSDYSTGDTPSNKAALPPPLPPDASEELSLDGFSSEEDTSSWHCSKCHHYEMKSETKCGNCKGWRDGKRPKKKRCIPSTSSDDEFEFDDTASPQNKLFKSIKRKSNLKPLYEINTPVYGPWWPDDDRTQHPSWYSGHVSNYITVSNSTYGPVRLYDIVYFDGDEVTEIEDSYVFGWEDYHMLTSNEVEWKGVKKVLDEGCGDEWAEVVGWYEVDIGERELLLKF